MSPSIGQAFAFPRLTITNVVSTLILIERELVFRDRTNLTKNR